jgi:hypothetical protein
MTKKDTHVSGKGLRGAIAYQEELAQEALIGKRFDRWIREKEEDEFMFRKFVVKAPVEEGGEYFAVLTAWVDGEPKVAFGSGVSITSSQHSIILRVLNGAIKWKEDQYG